MSANNYNNNNNKRKWNHSNQNQWGKKRKQDNHNPKDIKIQRRDLYYENKDFTKSTPNVSSASVSTASLNVYAPLGINVYDYAEARAYEIKNLDKELYDAKHKAGKRAHQKLPRHMRRRAASHDVRRLPKRLLERAKQEMDDTNATSKATRKYKRKPRNLLEEYTRRSRKKKWLETHIWHAKRFKMVEKWGYKIAEQPCDKSFRACYRASVKSCLIQDQSYMEVIEIIGCFENIKEGLSQLVSQQDNRFCDEHIYSGAQYSTAMIYEANKYPLHAIGPVRFLWVSNNSESECKIIFIVHPVISNAIIKEFTLIFNLEKLENEEKIENEGTLEVIEEQGSEDEVEKKCEEQVEANTEESIHKISGNIQKEEGELTDVENRTEQPTGKPTNTATSEEKYGGKVKMCKEEKKKERICVKNSIGGCQQYKSETITVSHYQLDFVLFSLVGSLSHSILQNVFKPVNMETKANAIDEVNGSNTEENKKTVSKESFFSFQEFSQKQRGVLNLMVEDPRLNLPQKKCNPFTNIKQTTKKSDAKNLEQEKSPLWDETLRHKYKDVKLADHVINKLRSTMLLPASHMNETGCVIPAVVLQRPPITHCANTSESSYGSGFDVLLPLGWAMPFWIAFQYEGARGGGLREDQNISLESFGLHFPDHYPDTQANKDLSQTVKKSKEEKHLRYPPDKRQSYDKLGIRNPFDLPWLDLIKDWKRNIVTLLSTVGKEKHSIEIMQETNYYVLRDVNVLKQLDNLMKTNSDIKKADMQTICLHQNSLIPVKIKSNNRGSPEDNALLCIPNHEDLQNLTKAATEEYPEEKYCGPLEPKHKGRIHEFPFVCKQNNIQRHNALTIGSNTRWIVGYVNSGRYLFRNGKGAGIGYISLTGLLYYLAQSLDHKTILFRNINTLIYRFCELEILTNP